MEYSPIITPSLFILIQMILGILWGKFWNITVGICFSLILIGISMRMTGKGKWRKMIYSCCFIGFTTFLTFWRIEKLLLLNRTQIWKIAYAVKIVKIDQKSICGKVYGYGVIKKIFHKYFKLLEGHRIYFYLDGDKRYVPSQMVHVQSNINVLKPNCKETFFSYLVQKNIFLYGYRGKILKIIGNETPINAFFANINRYWNDRIEMFAQKHGNHPSDGILYGVLLSEKKGLSKRQKDIFHNTGAAHLLAVSGLHIGMIGLVLDCLLRCFFLSKNWRRIPILMVIFFYVGAIGFPPSAVRAWLMITCHWTAKLFHRTTSGIICLINAAIISLIYDPLLLFDIGFQLSYGVVAMLLLLSVPIKDLLLWLFKVKGSDKILVWKKQMTIKSHIIQRIVELFSVSVSATLASAPLTYEYFNMFSLIGIILNPIIIQLALPTVACGFLFLTIGSLGMDNWLSDGLFWLARLGVLLIEKILSWSENHFPWYVKFLTKSNGFGILFFIVCLILALWIYNFHQKIIYRRR